jgi:ribokinase
MSKVIVVVGSLNMDFVVQVEKLPGRGETIRGEGFQMLPGGKGANQACAVARLGGRCKMIGRVGNDIFGEQLRSNLELAGVDTSSVWRTVGEPTGVALISVETGGQNQIVVAPGANGSLRPGDVEAAADVFRGGYLLLQLESPVETIKAAAALGRARGMMTILDPAPAQPLSLPLLDDIDLLTPNESEARILLDQQTTSVSLQEASEIAQRLLGLGPKCVILKLGEKGVWLADDSRSLHFPARRVEAVDATAAGDTFNGALAVALAENHPLELAIPFANYAAALSVTRLGAQASIPTRAEVEALFERRCPQGG